MKTEYIVVILAAASVYFFLKGRDSIRVVNCGVYGATSQEQCDMLMQQDAGVF